MGDLVDMGDLGGFQNLGDSEEMGVLEDIVILYSTALTNKEVCIKYLFEEYGLESHF